MTFRILPLLFAFWSLLLEHFAAIICVLVIITGPEKMQEGTCIDCS
jgi:hypothetical protein